MSFVYSAHAAIRAQQRAVPPLVVDWLMAYGSKERHRGANVYFLDKGARRTLKKEIGSLPYKRMEDLLDAYVVVSDDDKIITVAKRYKRLRRR